MRAEPLNKVGLNARLKVWRTRHAEDIDRRTAATIDSLTEQVARLWKIEAAARIMFDESPPHATQDGMPMWSEYDDLANALGIPQTGEGK